MKRFSRLTEALAFMPSPAGKVRLLVDYLASTPDPDRGWALAVLVEARVFREARPAIVRALAARRLDARLLALSHDFVGDLAETVALMWPDPHPQANSRPPTLEEVAVAVQQAPCRDMTIDLIEGWLDTLDASGRFTLLKLLNNGLRAGVSARLAKTALAAWGGVGIQEVEECWHGLSPPYAPLFAWLERRAPRPPAVAGVGFHPPMLAVPLPVADLDRLDPGAYAAEWKWGGVRVQLVAHGGVRHLYSRAGEDLSAAFPDVVERMGFDAVVDGMVMVGQEGTAAPIELHRRLSRKSATAKSLRDCPAFVHLYDILREGSEDLRGLSFIERRLRLERWHAAARPAAMTIPPLLAFADWAGVRALHAGAREAGAMGVVLKRRDSAYTAGREAGAWFKWDNGPLATLGAVLMYAQRGQGQPSSAAGADYTVGAWRGEGLVPVGKADAAVSAADRGKLEQWIRANTVNRFGPVREVAPALVVDVAFDGVNRSARHKSGLTLQAARITAIRWDEPAGRAAPIEAWEALATG